MVKPILVLSADERWAWYQEEKTLSGRDHLIAKEAEELAEKVIQFKPLNELIDEINKKMDAVNESDEDHDVILEAMGKFRDDLENLKKVIINETKKEQTLPAEEMQPQTQFRR